MKYKSKANYHIQNFFNLIATQFNYKIQQIRSANGTEFLLQDMKFFFQEHGVIPQCSCVYTPPTKWGG